MSLVTGFENVEIHRLSPSAVFIRHWAFDVGRWAFSSALSCSRLAASRRRPAALIPLERAGAGADLPTPPTLPGPVTAGGSRAIFRHIAGAGHVADSLRSYPVAERGLEREAWLTRTADGVGGPLVATPG